MDTARWIRRHQVGLYAVAVALAAVTAAVGPGLSSVLEQFIDPVLAVLLYVTFLEIPFVRFRSAFTNVRFVAAALSVNFLAVPVVVWLLTRPLPSDPALLVGVLLVLLTPCIDYVVTFTALADGDAEQLTATTPILLFVQLALLPAYLWLFLGPDVATVVDPRPFVEAFVLIIALPLTLAWVTESAAERSPSARRWQTAMRWLPVPAMGATLFVVVASQLPRVWDSLGAIAGVVPVYLAFLLVMPLVGRLAVALFALPLREGRALVFTATTRNSLVVLPLALAAATTYRLTPAVVVTQTLVELFGLVVLVRTVPTWLLPGDT
jgi:ACR3 family arsenite efflux pump ArsB